MAILQLPLPIAANTGVTPNLKMMKVTDDLTTITTAGYLTFSELQGYDVSPNDEIHIRYNASATDDSVGDLLIAKVQVSNGVITLVADSSEGNVILPVTVDHIATYYNTNGVLKNGSSTAINKGNLQAGLSGTAGTLISYPSTAAKGSLALKANDNAADYHNIIQNFLTAQQTTYNLLDPGVANAYFILSDYAAGQTINTGDLTVAGGDIIAGADGVAHKFVSYPATTTSGTFSFEGADNAGDFRVVLTHESLGQASTFYLPDPGLASAYINVSTTPVDPSSNIIWVDTSATVAELNGGGKAILSVTGVKQYKIREIFIGANTNFSGGGGDRDAQITDGTNVYSVIPAATMQNIVSARWGATNVPYPASINIQTTTTAGANIRVSYSGGAADYTAGEINISVCFERVA